MKKIILKIHQSFWAELLIIALAIVSVGLLIYEYSVDIVPDKLALIHSIDLLIAMLFFLHFSFGFYAHDDKKTYLKKEWYMLLASIPITDGIARALRSIRILRVVRLIRVIARIRAIGEVADRAVDRSSKYIYSVCVAVIIIFTGAVAMYTLEAEINAGLTNFFDAVWWAVVTTTTVGYGDILPMTVGGRLVAMAMMLFGIGLVGAVAGFVGSDLLRNFLHRKK